LIGTVLDVLEEWEYVADAPEETLGNHLEVGDACELLE
jgi:hypothetical protein